MRGFIFMVLAAAAATTGFAQVGVAVGVEPVCPYGYYDVAPYTCAPPGYYGPEWFDGGLFIGVGPWFHGHENFRGFVDNRYHPDHGYKGPFPARGEKFDPARRVDHSHFKGSEMRDGHGRVHRPD
jgi:hypothetical protein